VLRRLTATVESIVELIWWQRNLTAFQTVYTYLTILIPIAVLAPQYFAGAIEFGVISQGSSAFSTVRGPSSPGSERNAPRRYWHRH
jgi:putative ATP-binding cassette transporter